MPSIVITAGMTVHFSLCTIFHHSSCSFIWKFPVDDELHIDQVLDNVLSTASIAQLEPHQRKRTSMMRKDLAVIVVDSQLELLQLI